MWRGRSQGLRGEIKNTQAKEENKRLMRDMTGADNAKEHHKFMRGKKVRGGEGRWENKGSISGKGENKMHEGEILNVKGENEGLREIR